MKKRHLILVPLLLLINSQISISQIPFHKTVGDTTENWANCIKRTGDGGYILTGYANDSVYDDFDVYLVKMNASFELEWTKTYGGTNVEIGNSVIQTSDGGYVITGRFMSSTPPINMDVYILKTDSIGNLTWSYTYGAQPIGYAEEGHKVFETSDGGFVIAVENGLIKIDFNGIFQWQSTYNFGVTSMDETPDGGYVLGGRGYCGNSCILIARLDSAGNLLWTHQYDDNTAVYSQDVLSTSDGAFVITGYGSISTSNTAIILMKADSTGGLLWYKEFNLQSRGAGYDVLESIDGGYVVMGRSYNGFSNAAALVKTDNNGNVLWAKQYGSFGGDEYAISGLQTNDGGYVFTGFTFGFGTIAGDIYLVKTDSLGFTNCNETNTVVTYLTPGVTDTSIIHSIDTTAFIAISYPVTVGSHGSDSLLCTLVGLAPNIDQSTVNIQISPNPSNGQFTISFNRILKNGTIEIYNSLGKMVYSNHFVNAFSTEINNGNFSSGIYFISVNDNEKYYFEKVIVE